MKGNQSLAEASAKKPANDIPVLSSRVTMRLSYFSLLFSKLPGLSASGDPAAQGQGVSRLDHGRERSFGSGRVSARLEIRESG